MCSSLTPLRPQQCFYSAAFVHGLVALSYLIERQSQIENLAGVNLSDEHQLDQFREVAAHRGRSTVQVDVREEQLLAVEFNPVRDANVAHKPTRACGTDGLHHRFLRANTLKRRISPDAIRQFLDARHTFISHVRHYVRRTKFSSELLARRVTAHGDDSLCAHLFRGEHAEQTDRTVTDYRDSRARLHVGCIGGKPTSAHDIGECQQVWNQIRRRYVRCGHQSAVREWDTQQQETVLRPPARGAGRTTGTRSDRWDTRYRTRKTSRSRNDR